jgi:cephalosporin-C deacetylase-like acetyl esterase
MHITRIGQWTGILILLAALISMSSSLSALPLSQKSNNESAKLFAYTQSKAFDIREESSKEQDGATIKDITYAAYSPQRGRIKSYLVKPSGKGRFAAVLFFHWYGAPKGDRTEFLDEAVALAKQGVVSLLIQGYLPWAEPFTDLEADRRRVIEQTIEVRRALDLLLSQPGVDAKRVGYVGHDYGAMYGGIVAGVDKRLKACVLVAGMGSFSDWSLKYWPATAAKGEEAYRRGMEAIDPVRFVARAAPAALMFQFANQDKYIPKATATAFYDAGSQPKQLVWYEAKHDLDIEAARNHRRDFLTRQLKLANPK